MVYVIRTYLSGPLGAIGRRFGLSSEGSAGVVAASANILALYHMIKVIPPKDKVLCIAFAVCSAFLLGDHLAFTANFQPNMILPLITREVHRRDTRHSAGRLDRRPHRPAAGTTGSGRGDHRR